MLRLYPLALLGLAACVAAPPPPSAAPPAPESPPAPAPPAEVWSREAGLALSGGGAVPYLGTRLEVMEARPDSLHLRCPACPGAPVGWAPREAVAWEETSPAAARAGDLASFMVALRAAALRQDWEGLRGVMSQTFVHSISGPDGTLEAIGAWRGTRAADLARLPALLDRGAALVPGTAVWAAPPEFAALRGYQDLRAGFLRGRHGWEWVFLVRGEL